MRILGPLLLTALVGCVLVIWRRRRRAHFVARVKNLAHALGIVIGLEKPGTSELESIAGGQMVFLIDGKKVEIDVERALAALEDPDKDAGWRRLKWIVQTALGTAR